MSWRIYCRRAVKATLTVVLTAFAIHGQSSESDKNYMGDGGKGMSLTIYVPQSTGLAKDQSYIPALVQGEFVSNFSNYSAISILDWERLDDIYVKLIAEEYDDKAAAKMDAALGRLAPTSHFLTGNITKTATGYNVKMNITATSNKMTTAAYSGTFTFAELDNLTGVRRASLELLQKAGVKLTDKAKRELAGTVEANEVLAQTALAKGVTAQRQGTEVAALSYYFQAANFNPSLKEAVKRSSVVAANISSGNIGADIRNDIEWRKKWVAKLKETEEIFHEMFTNIMASAVDPPYKLYYFTDINKGKVDYEKETVDLSININMSANRAWFNAMKDALGAVQVVSDGLSATKRRSDWGLSSWPWKGVSDKNPFAKDSRMGYDVTAVFELADQKGRLIGDQAGQSVKLNPGFSFDDRGSRFAHRLIGDNFETVTFKGVKADDVGDNLTIRIASVNGAPPQKARFPILAMPMVEKTRPFTDSRDGKKYNTVKIGGKVWMAENLNYPPKAGNAWCSDNNDSKCDAYGRLYDWNTAMTSCPSGWYLPSSQDWDLLAASVGGKKSSNYGSWHTWELSGKKLKTQSGWTQNGDGTDDFGFSALPGGYRMPNGQYVSAGGYGYWWTATTESDSGDGRAYYRSMTYNRRGGDGDNLREHGLGKGHGVSVRCVKQD